MGNFTNHTNVTKFFSQVIYHDATQNAAQVEWTTSGLDRYFQSNWTVAGVGNDIGAYQTLDFRVSRGFGTLNLATPTNCTIQLVMADGSVSSAVSLCKYADLRGPVGGPVINGMGGLHPILQTVRIPLTDFANANLSQVRGVRFVFNITPTGSIYLANLRLSH